MLRTNLTGYVNSVRHNKVGDKVVSNIRINVPLGKNKEGKQEYQSFDVAFWGDSSANVSTIKEKDYVTFPDVTINRVDTTTGKDGKIYVNINGMGMSAFVAPERKGKSESSSAESKPVNTDDIPF